MNATDLRGDVLVVEDDVLYAAMLADQLRLAGLAVTLAGDLPEALSALAARRFDVVVADLHLPGSEETLSPALLAAIGETPLLLMTGTPTIDSALRSLQQRVFAYFVKPFDVAPFLEAVSQAVTQGGLRQRLGEARRRYRFLDDRLDALQHLAGSAAASDINQSMADYLRLLLGSSAEAILEAVDILDTLEQGSLATPVRRLSRDPESAVMRAELAQAVDVLERTRHSFKSRELADLRRRLEQVLASSGRIDRS